MIVASTGPAHGTTTSPRLTPSTNPPTGGAEGTVCWAKGCTKAAKSLIGAIESHPNNYYVNVHTAKYRAGAIRGQLVADMMHM